MRSPFSSGKQSHVTKIVDVCRRSQPPRLSLNSRSTCFGSILALPSFVTGEGGGKGGGWERGVTLIQTKEISEGFTGKGGICLEHHFCVKLEMMF